MLVDPGQDDEHQTAETDKSSRSSSASQNKTAADHVIEENDAIGKGGLATKFRDNLVAIRLLKTLEAEKRSATPEERKTLSRYVGWGAMKEAFNPNNKKYQKQYEELKGLLTEEEFAAARRSTLNAHYTSPLVVKTMFAALTRMGFTGGRILEPSLGIGNFFGLMPAVTRKRSELFGVELDRLTARMAQALYPNAKIAAMGFQDYEVNSEYFDLVIGNPPFGEETLHDADHSPYSGFSIHNYFLAKGIDKLRPGGLMAVVVSRYFLDKVNGKERLWLGERADLVGAVRLPNTAFKENAGTEVVTDILIFRKKEASAHAIPLKVRAPLKAATIAPSLWTSSSYHTLTNPKSGERAEVASSDYFEAYPANVLGKVSAAGSMYTANEYTVTPEGDVEAGLAAWVDRLEEGLYLPIERKKTESSDPVNVPPKIKVGSYYVDASTKKIMRRLPDQMGEKRAEGVTFKNETAGMRLRGMIEIRDALKKQMALESAADSTPDAIESHRKVLNDKVEAFQKKYGYMNNATNRPMIFDDPESNLLYALEFDFDKGVSEAVAKTQGIEPRPPRATKADILKKRVLFPYTDEVKVESAKDALLASLNHKGGVDLSYMESLYSKPRAAIMEDLGDLVFVDPTTSEVVDRDGYLSGDVKTKLVKAQEAARDDRAFERNVRALTEVIPADKRPSEITISLGSHLVPSGTMVEFVKHITGAQNVKASYNRAMAKWSIDVKGAVDPMRSHSVYGTADKSALDLLVLSLDERGAVVRAKDIEGRVHVLEKETAAVREKQEAIKAEWKSWLWKDGERAERMAKIYNEKMNRIVNRSFDGSHLTLPNASPAITLLPHQKNGVWRGLQTRQMLLDHVVGAGKTFTMIALVMEMRRLNLAKKPLIVVPNHLTTQWQSDFMRLYPAANVLAATPEDFAKDKRQRMFAKIITGDWDAVIIGHSSLTKIGLSDEIADKIDHEQIEDLVVAIEEAKKAQGNRSSSVRELEKRREKLEASMKKRKAKSGKKDLMATIDETGVDALLVDELHEFKNLYYATSMDRVPGMGNPAGSGKAYDLFCKIRWLFEKYGNKAVVIGATGTPVSNSLVEMYNMQRLLSYPTMRAEDLHLFDAWTKQYGSVVNVYEVSTSGVGYKQTNRLQKFNNLPALMARYKTFADIVTLDHLIAQEESQGRRFPVPKVEGGRAQNKVAKRSPDQLAYIGEPYAKTDAGGNIVFRLPEVDQDAVVVESPQKKNEPTRFKVKATGETFPSEKEAREAVVEQALSPVTTIDAETLLGKFDNLKALMRASKGAINALSLTNLANKAGLDMRMIDASMPDYPGSKVNLAVEEMLRLYKKWEKDRGAQLVFCDLSVPHSEKKRAAKEGKKVFVREGDEVLLVKATIHTVEAAPYLPFFLVEKTQENKKTVWAYEAQSGLMFLSNQAGSKAEVIEKIQSLLSEPHHLEKLVGAREALGAIPDNLVEDYIAAHEIDEAMMETIAKPDEVESLAGGSAGVFSVYDDIKSKLSARGVPEAEIAFIHDYQTPKQKDSLFKAVNRGEIRFLLGSTPKMGAGTNVQERLVGLHHIDAVWRPSDVEQREGRIIRRGNKLYDRDPEGFSVFIGRYATEQTYDTRRWQLLEHKARVIAQIRNYDESVTEIEDISDEAANMQDMKAAASGDPMILEEIRLRNEVTRLEKLEAASADNRLFLKKKADSQRYFYETEGKKRIADAQALVDKVTPKVTGKEAFEPVTIGRVKYVDKEKAYVALLSEFGTVKTFIRSQSEAILYRGLKFHLTRGGEQGSVLIASENNMGVGGYAPKDNFSAAGLLTRLDNFIDHLSPSIQEIKERMEQAKVLEREYLKGGNEPFAQAAELQQTRERHKKIRQVMMIRGADVPLRQKAKLEEGLKAQKEKLKKAGFQEELDAFIADTNITFSLMQARGDLARAGGLTLAQMGDVVSRVQARFYCPIPVTVKAGFAETFPMVAGKVKAGMRVNGVVADGQIYVFCDAHQTLSQAEETLFHEVFHLGLRRVMTRAQYIPAMKRLYRRSAAIQTFVKDWINQDTPDVLALKAENDPDYLMARGVDEFLADLAAKLSTNKTPEARWQRLAKIVVDWMAGIAEALGFKEVAARLRAYTNTEAIQLVRSVFRASGIKDQNEGARQALPEPMSAPSARSVGETPAGMTFSIQRSVTEKYLAEADTQFKKFGVYAKTLSTQYNKALRNVYFKKVFDLVSAFENTLSLTALAVSETAPLIIHKVDDVTSSLKAFLPDASSERDLRDAGAALFDGTLLGEAVLGGKVWTDQELKARRMTDKGMVLYRQARAAVDGMIDQTAAAEAYAIAASHHLVGEEVRAAILAHVGAAETLIMTALKAQEMLLQENVNTQKDKKLAEYASLKLKACRASMLDVEKIFKHALSLKKAGYMPLKRFGRFTVTVTETEDGQALVDEAGRPVTVFFGKYETRREAKDVIARMAQEFEFEIGAGTVAITLGTESQDKRTMFEGATHEAVALFGEAIGLKALSDEYMRLINSERSVLKHRLRRKGVAGFSDNLSRVLVTFITSSARYCAEKYYLRDINQAVMAIPKSEGEVIDEAIKLKKFVLSPNDAGAGVSSLMFAWYLGGSVAAAVVNLTQPFLMTLPVLTQYGMKQAHASLARAIKTVLSRQPITDKDLREGLRRASRAGIVEAQEIFHLYTLGIQSMAAGINYQLSRLPLLGKKLKPSDKARTRLNAVLTLWGALFSMAEKFNRKVTFMAAWEIAQKKGIDPYPFAVRMVNETQGIYSKVNRPNWGRNPAGRVILIFKQFSLMYLELLYRLWKDGGREGKRAAILMVAVMILASGEEGAPGALDLEDVIDTLLQLFGYETPLKHKKRELAYQMLGEHGGDFILYGAGSFLPMDLTYRLGLGDVIPATGFLKPSNSGNRARELIQLGGATAGFGQQLTTAYDSLASGNFEKSLQNVSPKAIRDLSMGIEMAATKKATDAKGREIAPAGGSEALVKTMGFTPSSVAKKQREAAVWYERLRLRNHKEAELADTIAEGRINHDLKVERKARDEVDAWNARHPDLPIEVTERQIKSRIQLKGLTKDQLMERQTPPEVKAARARGL